MGQLSPRLGYYIISVGTTLEFLGLVGDSWSSDSSNVARATFSFSQPGDVLLIVGLAVTVLGTIIGLLSLAEELSNHIDRPPRLLPVLPLVLLVGISIGSVAFAVQAADSPAGTGAVAASSTETPSGLVSAASPTPVCPPGSFWLATAQNCMSLEVDDTGQRVAVTPLAPGQVPDCPEGTFWHPVMVHCMPVSAACPAGFAWSTALGYCEPLGAQPTSPSLEGGPTPTPVCPSGTFWHPVMNHCMSTVCPAGFQFDYTALTCVPAGGPVPTSTPPLGTTPTATPTPSCPDGYFWHPAMGHCMSTECPPGLVWNPDTLYCELPSTGTPTATPPPATTPSPTPVSTPSCPDGYFWHPAMGHCMSTDCPPGLVWNPDTLYCELPSTETPTETPTPTATPTQTAEATATPVSTPSCPDGYFWHPAMGHCMSTECPPGLVWDPKGLYCVLPTPTATPGQAGAEN